MLNKKEQQEKEYTEDSVIVSRDCSVTNKTYKVTLSKEQYNRWQAGEFIQDVAPNMHEDDREFLISGITPQEWDKLFKDEE